MHSEKATNWHDRDSHEESTVLFDKNLLLFGCDFFTAKKTSEVNFWNDMVRSFAIHLGNVVILSVNNRRIGQEQLEDNVFLYKVFTLD